MEDKSKLVADCYAEGERAGMLRFQQLRARALMPLLKLLTRLGINATHHGSLVSERDELLLGLVAVAFVGAPLSAAPCAAGWPGRSRSTIPRDRLSPRFVDRFDV